MLNKEELDLSRIPQHVAIIMDGNGRWAKLRGQERSYGHQAGAETVHVIAEEASKLGIKYLTLYTFSTENWNRPSNEVAALMALGNNGSRPPPCSLSAKRRTDSRTD